MIDEQVDALMGLPEYYPVVVDTAMSSVYAAIVTSDNDPALGTLYIYRD